VYVDCDGVNNGEGTSGIDIMRSGTDPGTDPGTCFTPDRMKGRNRMSRTTNSPHPSYSASS